MWQPFLARSKSAGCNTTEVLSSREPQPAFAASNLLPLGKQPVSERRARGHANQFSTFRPVIRSKSRRFRVTKVRFRPNATPASQMSCKARC